ncbi:MAG: hypothetical protein ACI4CX_04615 [Candidatus Weimeria sp.]
MEKIQEKELDDLLDEASSLGDSEEDQAKAQYIEYEYQSRDGGLSRLESQRDALNEKSDQKKYFFDEAALSAQFSDINTDLLIFLISGIVLVITVSGIEGADTGSVWSCGHAYGNHDHSGYETVECGYSDIDACCDAEMKKGKR